MYKWYIGSLIIKATINKMVTHSISSFLRFTMVPSFRFLIGKYFLTPLFQLLI